MAKQTPVDAGKNSALKEAGFIEDVDQEGQPGEYDMAAEKEKEAKILEQQKNSPNAEAVPEGVADMPDIEKEERAEAMKDPFAHLSRIERAQMEKFGTPAPQQSANPQIIAGSDPFSGPMPSDPYETEGKPKTPETGAFIMVQFYSGRFRLYYFNHLESVKGFAQAQPGTKRLFRYVGQNEMQEIDGLGRPKRG